MRINTVKRILQSGQPSFGTWLSLGDLLVARVLARMGWDWLTVDMEHQPIDWSQAATLFGAIADAGCVPLCRVPEGTHFFIKRAMDAGAFGIVVPMVNTVEQAQAAIAAAKYPPLGNRSVGGSLHSLNFATDSVEYYAKANDEIMVILQTESPEGVKNAEAIYSLPGVDAIFVGPNDLKAQMRKADGTEATTDEFEAMLSRIIEIGKKTGTPTGMHCMDAQQALLRSAQGMQFIAVGSDLRMLSVQAQETLQQLRPGSDAKDTVKY
ncbi:MAG: aldolase/citrate lyase family protein [Planctomycetota bacterium]|nr:aldolase/citrate lyase family protein [Planctomycetota bacterium]